MNRRISFWGLLVSLLSAVCADDSTDHVPDGGDADGSYDGGGDPHEDECKERWCWEHPYPTGHDLLAVWGRAANDVWAVGDQGTILHWEGSRWKAISSETDAPLRGVWGSSASDVWVVGDGSTILRWDGERFTRQETEISGGIILRGVWGSSANDVWVGGELGGGLLHFDGSAWTQLEADLPVTYAIWGAGKSDVWAVGGRASHFDGDAWIQNSPATKYVLYDVEGSGPNDVWIVGGEGGSTYHFAGAKWSAMASGSPLAVRSLWVRSETEALAVGDAGAILRWDGTSWSPQTSGTERVLHGIWGASPDDIWAVGEGGTILHFDGAAWSKTSVSLTTSDLHAVWATDDSDVWAVGAMGTILHSDGVSWSVEDSGAVESLFSVWASERDNVWAVGEAGATLHFDGQSWATSASATKWALYDVWGVAADQVFAIGLEGTRWNGSRWEIWPGSPGGESLWGGSDSDIWVVGAGEIVHHWDGTSWSEQSLVRIAGEACCNTHRLRSVWGESSTSAWAVGLGPNQSGMIVEFDGAAWRSGGGSDTPELYGVWAMTNGDLWAVGKSGTIMPIQGIVTSVEEPPEAESGTNRDLSSVAGSGESVWVVGNAGTILRYRY